MKLLPSVQADGPLKRKRERQGRAAHVPHSQRQEKPGRATQRDGRVLARSGNTIIAWEFRTPSGWYANPAPLLTVLDAERIVALQYVYELGRTTGDVDCGHVDLVPIRRNEALALGWSGP